MKTVLNARVARRAFLQMLAGTGASYFLPSLAPRKAWASPPAIPTRLVLVYGMGSIRSFWPPLATAGNPAPTETSFQMGPLHQALTPYQQNLIFIDGMDMVSAAVDPTGGANAHVGGGTHALTAINRLTPSLSSGVSIDQFIAQQINSPTPLTKFPYLIPSASLGGDVEGGPTYVASGQVVGTQQSVVNLYNSAFDPSTVGNAQAAALHLAQERAALSYASGEFAALSPRLSSADKLRIDLHASTLSDLGTRLGLTANAACQPPGTSFTSEMNQLATMNELNQPAYSLQRMDLMSQLTVAALQCDLTRVVTLHLPTHYDLEPAMGYTSGMWGTSDSHDLTHKTNNSSAPLWNTPDAMTMIKQVHTFQAQMFAQLIQRMKAVVEPDGQSLLDHSVVLWCGQIAEGGHSLNYLPWIIAGSGGGYFRTGRYLKMPRTANNNWPDYSAGPPHNNLFVSVANAMGVPITTFGNSQVCTGPLAGLT